MDRIKVSKSRCRLSISRARLANLLVKPLEELCKLVGNQVVSFLIPVLVTRGRNMSHPYIYAIR